MGRYLDKTTFKQWAHDDVKVDDNLIDQAIAAAEELIDQAAGRELQVVTGSTVASARQIAPTGSTDVLQIWDADEVTTVVENGVTLTEGTHYQLEPLNQLSAVTGAYRPYDTIRRLSGCWYVDSTGAPSVTVTAKWGWAQASIPSAVIEACKVLANDWLGHRHGGMGNVGVTPDGFTSGAKEWPMVRKAVASVTVRTPMLMVG